VVLFYGRYGSSPAGTLLATLLALLCTWMFLQRKRPAWWMAGLCAVTLFTATLQYSPGRLVVLILLGLLVVVPLWQWRRMTWQRGVGLLLIFIAAYGVWQFETSQRRQHYFLHARGEQFFSLLENPATVETLLGKKLDRVPGRNAAETWRGQLALLNQFMQTTVPQYVSRMSPNLSAPMGGGIVDIDPPPLPLYYAPLAIFIVLGLVYSMRQLGTFTHFCLLAWVGGITLPLLMTNRVDVHRIMLFLVPLSIWAALGIREAVNILHAASIPRLARQVLGAVLLATLVYSDIHLLHRSADEIPQPFAAPLLAAEIDSISDPVVLGWDWDNREVGWLHLKMLERMRRDPQWRGERLAPGLRYAARADGGHPTPHAVHGLQTLAATHTILLAPAERFKEIAAVLQQRGVRVARRGNERFRFFRLDAGATATGVPDEEMRPLPTIVILPTPTPVTLQSGPHIPLSGLEALDVSFEFAEPRMNRTWQGGPIRMGGHVYPQGIGMHAWTRMTYAVPPEAKALQAVIGLSDGIKECTKASVTFEVEDQDGNRLYDSGLVDVSAPPIPIRVDLRGATTITLVVSDAGNGIDCDHANWALPGFLLDPS
jgi:hypothetical protein